MRHLQIVSAPMPTGVAWLVNCLMELDIRTTPDGAYWQDEPGGSRLIPAEVHENLLWYLPALHRRQSFDFAADDAEVFWDHRLTFVCYPARPTVLFVRDPRDTIYSQFRRLVHHGSYRESQGDLFAYLHQRETWPISFPLLFDLPPADTLAYYYITALQLVPPEQLLVVRFEDSKRDPAGQLRRVLDFLGIQRSEARIQAALAQSDVRHSLAIGAKMAGRPGPAKLSSRGGRIGEWQTAYSPLALSAFEGPASVMLQLFGYQPLPAVPARAPLRSQGAPLPALERIQALMAGADLNTAETLIRETLTAPIEPTARLQLAGQWLALLWTRAVLREAQSELPIAGQMARCLGILNAAYASLPEWRQAAAEILRPAHPLHALASPNPIFSPSLATEADFLAAMPQARASGRAYLLWRRPDCEISPAGLWQLCTLLGQPRPEPEAVMPQCLPHRSPLSEAQAAHARWGAEFARVTLHRLPPLLLIRCDALPAVAPASLGIWLAGLRVYRARGVLAWLRTD